MARKPSAIRPASARVLPIAIGPKATLSRTLIQVKSAPCWKTTPRRGSGPRTGAPSISTSPGRRRLETGEDVEQRALAAPRRAHEADERPLLRCRSSVARRLYRLGTVPKRLETLSNRALAGAEGGAGRGSAGARHLMQAIFARKLLSIRPLRSFGMALICPVSFRNSACTWSVLSDGGCPCRPAGPATSASAARWRAPGRTH